MGRRLVRTAFLTGLFVFAMVGTELLLPSQPAKAVVGINRQINFQGRLLAIGGAVVPDGNYNMEFKIYQDGNGNSPFNDGETLKWTETRLNNNSQGVNVKNGYFSVMLGSVTAFGTSVDWDQDTLWLTINVGNTNTTCTPFSNCVPDGEMSPAKRLGANPYALNSQQLGGLEKTNFVQLAQGLQTDASAANASIAINKTGGTANILQLQRGGVDKLTVNNAGDTTVAGTLTASGATLLQGNVDIGDAAADLVTVNGTLQGASPLVFEGAGPDDAFETTFAISSPTADRTITFPNASITVNAAADISGTLTDAQVSDTLTASIFVGSGSTTNAIDLATAEVAGTLADGNVADNITASNYLPLTGGTITGNLTIGDAVTDTLTVTSTIQGGSPLVFEGLTDDTFETTFALTDPTADNTITFPNASITVNAAGQLSGNTLAAGVTGSSLTSVGTITVGVWNGTALTDTYVSDTLTSSIFKGSGTTTDAIDLATAEVAGNLKASNLQAAAADLGAADVTINLGNTNASFNTNITTDGAVTATTFIGALSGNATTATALAANPADCVATQFATAIAANGNLSCAALTDNDIPDSITASNYLLLTGGTITGNLTIGDAVTDTLNVTSVLQGASPLVFEGATDNAFETTFALTDPTVDRIITFPDGSLTVNSAADIFGSTLSSSVVTSSLTTVGALSTGSIASGFGTISTGNNITTTATIQGGTVTTTGNFTGTGAVTLQSGGTGALTLDSASDTIVIAASDTTIQKSGTALTIDLNSASNSTLTITNSGAGTGSLSVETGYQIGGAAVDGRFLRGNGTNFVANTIQAADVPDLSATYIKNQTSQQSSSNFNISGTGVAGVALQAPIFDTATAAALGIGSTNATQINLNQNTVVAATKTLTVTSGLTSLTGNTTGDALNVSNSTSSGNIAVFKDGDDVDAVFTIANGGATTLQNVADSTSALAVKNAAGDVVVKVDTTNKALLPGASPTAGVNSTVITAVDTTGSLVQSRTSIAIGTDGFPVVAYQDFTNKDLKILKCGNATCSSGNSATTVDSTGDVGDYASITIGTDDFPVVSYNDATNRDLKVLKCGNLSCSSGNTITAVDTTGDLQFDTSIVIGSDGKPFISYRDATNTRLKVVRCGNSSCSSGNTITAVETSGNTGFHNSVALGTDGLPIVAYNDSADAHLKILKCGNLNCSSGNTITAFDVSAITDVGSNAKIAIRPNGLPAVAYTDSTNFDLKFLDCSNSACSSGSVSILESANDVGGYAAITIGTDGFPLMSHHDSTNGTLRIFACGNSTCSSGNRAAVVDSSATNVGVATSIKIVPNGLPFIAYRDVTNTDLKVAACGDKLCINNGTDGGATMTGGTSIGSIGAFFNNVFAAQYWGRQFQIANFDLAEEYPVTDTSIEAGDVVRFSSAGGLAVERTTSGYEPTAMGIVSTTPAITLGDWPTQVRTNLRPIALAGRVPVKCTDENGPINPGDRLTTSATKPGYAMKATAAGPTIGIALEALASGEGKIMSFVKVGYHNPATDTMQGAGTAGEFNSLNISGVAVINTLTVTSSITTKNIIVLGQIIAGPDVTGKVTIPAGQTEATYTFAEPYTKPPEVFLSAGNSSVTYTLEVTESGFTVKLPAAFNSETNLSYFVISTQ